MSEQVVEQVAEQVVDVKPPKHVPSDEERLAAGLVKVSFQKKDGTPVEFWKKPKAKKAKKAKQEEHSEEPQESHVVQ